MTERAVLLFDGESELSRTSVRWVVRHDRHKRLVPVPIQSPDGQGLLARVPPSRRGYSWHLVLDGRVYSGTDVLDPLLELLDHPLAVRFLKRAIGGMSRVQARPASAEVGNDMPVIPDAPADSNGGGAPTPEPAPPPEAPPAPEAPLPPEAVPAPEAPPPPEAATVADAAPAVGVIDRPAPVGDATPEPSTGVAELPAHVADRPAQVAESPAQVAEPPGPDRGAPAPGRGAAGFPRRRRAGRGS